MSEDGGGGVWHVRKWTPFGMCGEVLGKDMKSAADETHSLDSAGAPSAAARGAAWRLRALWRFTRSA